MKYITQIVPEYKLNVHQVTAYWTCKGSHIHACTCKSYDHAYCMDVIPVVLLVHFVFVAALILHMKQQLTLTI